MNTMTSYKVVYLNEYGDLLEEDCQTLEQAQQIKSQYQNAKLYRIKMIGSIEEIP